MSSTEFYTFEQVLETFDLRDSELRNAVSAGLVKPVVEHEARFLAILVLKPEGLEALRGLAADLYEVRVTFSGAVQGTRVLFAPADRALGRLLGDVVADVRTIAELAREAGIVPGQPLALDVAVPRAPAWQTRPVLPPDGCRDLEAPGAALVERLAAEGAIRILVERHAHWRFRKSDLDQLTRGQMTQPTLILPVTRAADTAAGFEPVEDDAEELPDFEDASELALGGFEEESRPKGAAPPPAAAAERVRPRETGRGARPPATSREPAPGGTTTGTFGGAPGAPPPQPAPAKPAAAAPPPPADSGLADKAALDAPAKKQSAPPPEPPAPAPRELPPMPASRSGGSPSRRARSAVSRPATPATEEESGDILVDEEDSGLRRTTVRYYSQMYPFECFPLLVVLSEKKIRRIQMKDVAQVEGTERIEVTAEEPLVEVVPHFPGCQVVPERIVLDVTPRQAEARFYVTPMVEGTIPEASVQILRGRKVLDRVSTPCRVTKQTMAKLALGMSVASPVVSTLFESFDVSLRDELPTLVVWLGRAVDAIGGPSVAGILLFVALLAIAGVLYRRNRPRQAEPVVDFLDVEAVGSPRKRPADAGAAGRFSL